MFFVDVPRVDAYLSSRNDTVNYVLASDSSCTQRIEKSQTANPLQITRRRVSATHYRSQLSVRIEARSDVS